MTCTSGTYINCAGYEGKTTACHRTSTCSNIPPGMEASAVIYESSTTATDLAVVSSTAAYPQNYPNAGVQALSSCAAGNYNDGLKNFCRKCTTEPGYGCDIGSGSSTGSQCPIGFYCPGGTGSAAAPQPCTTAGVPVGKYCPAGSTSMDSALACPIGNYCAGGSAAPAPCAAAGGYYCILGSSTFTLCPALSY